jgi:hypothetical protein
MSVANGSKDLIEEFDHLSPLPHESLGKGVNMRSDLSISALFALVKGKMENEIANL